MTPGVREREVAYKIKYTIVKYKIKSWLTAHLDKRVKKAVK
jgi:hypothetical protein